MSQYKMMEIGRPDAAALQEAILVCDGKSGDGSGEALMAAGMVVIGEACAQLDNDHKTQDEVIASLVERGLSEGVATVWVNKAHDVVNDMINKDPERFVREHTGGISKGEIVLYVAVLLLAIFIVWPD